ncbi:hypothetical protein JVT61DRAFT_4238 [Boletus reticuloceps]|uniref:Uncharacterized protein n=1 Tax=Boletus reticuloceps TaxID=495285 RepID=A0A8I3A988_9AGAM|nr:hypothetical protein JVT61DRAFT_4238 [Boletus reticuloceps]
MSRLVVYVRHFVGFVGDKFPGTRARRAIFSTVAWDVFDRRKEIETGIKSESSKTEEDRNMMIELLKQIGDQSALDEDGLFNHSDEDEEDSLAHRVSAIDISSASADNLLRVLTKKERDKFFVALKDPSSKLLRELLESAEFEKTRQLPWWDAPSDGSQSSLSLRIPYGVKPDLIVIPTDLINQAYGGVSLLYNICAVLLAYAYVTRHLAMSPLSLTTNDSQDKCEARRIILQSVPFLVDRKSKTLHMSLTEVVTSFWSRLDPGSIGNETMFVLLEDVVKLVRPRRITVAEHSSGEREPTMTSAADHPLVTSIMVMSDIISLFSNHVDSSAFAVRRSDHIVMKLTFYAAHVLSTPSSRLHALADEASLVLESIGKGLR